MSFLALLLAALLGAGDAARGDRELAGALARFQSVRRQFEAGKELFARGDLDGAARRFRACTAKLAGHAYAHYYLANIQYLRGDYPGALAAIDAAESHLEAMMEMGAYARARSVREVDEAARSLAKYYDSTDSCRERRDLEGVLLTISQAEEKAQAMGEREQALRRALASEYAGFHGNILFQLKRYEEALAFFMRAVAADPQNGQAYNNIVAIYYLAGRFAEADRHLQAAERAGVGEAVNLKLQALVGAAVGRSTAGILEQEYGPDRASGLRVVRFTANVYEGQAERAPLFANAYVAFDPQSRDAVLIDPGSDDPRIDGFIRENDLSPRLILNSHGHPDHCRGDLRLARLYGVKIVVQPGDAASVREEASRRGGSADLLFPDADFRAGSISVRRYATPGHTPGSACFRVGAWLFSGDSLFADTVGFIPASGGTERRAALSRLAATLQAVVRELPAETEVLPGHGRSATLAQVRAVNPFLRAGGPDGGR